MESGIPSLYVKFLGFNDIAAKLQGGMNKIFFKKSWKEKLKECAGNERSYSHFAFFFSLFLRMIFSYLYAIQS